MYKYKKHKLKIKKYKRNAARPENPLAAQISPNVKTGISCTIKLSTF